MQRVVLVDDDASIRRLVEMALDGLPIELVCCAGVAQARAVLEAAPAALLVTDLMMPGETGYDLLQWLAERPAVRGAARLVAFSAGIDAEARARLAALGVWRELAKPVSIAALEACVEEALGLAGTPPLAAAPATAPALQGRDGDVQRGIAQNFGGDAALYGDFRAQAVAQFAADLAEGDRLLTAGDLAAQRRLAHSLKGVLALLGHAADAGVARQLEQAAAAGDRSAWPLRWPELRSALIDLGRSE